MGVLVGLLRDFSKIFPDTHVPPHFGISHSSFSFLRGTLEIPLGEPQK